MQILYETAPVATTYGFIGKLDTREILVSREHAMYTHAYIKQDNSRSPRISYGARFALHKQTVEKLWEKEGTTLCTLIQTLQNARILFELKLYEESQKS